MKRVCEVCGKEYEVQTSRGKEFGECKHCYTQYKKCFKCNTWLIANSNNFANREDGRFGLRNSCRQCEKQYREDNKERRAKNYQQWYQNNKDKKKEYSRQHRANNKEQYKEYDKQYYQDNKERKSEYRKQWYQEHKKECRIRFKKYYEKNKEQMSEQKKQYFQTSQGQIARFNGNTKRRLKEEKQGDGITKEQWVEMMNYFDWKCAYSGIELNRENRSIDHIRALNLGGEHKIWNIVPMYMPYNSSKKDKSFLDWYEQQEFYSEERLNKIFEWQKYAYKKWGINGE